MVRSNLLKTVQASRWKVVKTINDNEKVAYETGELVTYEPRDPAIFCQ